MNYLFYFISFYRVLSNFILSFPQPFYTVKRTLIKHILVALSLLIINIFVSIVKEIISIPLKLKLRLVKGGKDGKRIRKEEEDEKEGERRTRGE